MKNTCILKLALCFALSVSFFSCQNGQKKDAVQDMNYDDVAQRLEDLSVSEKPEDQQQLKNMLGQLSHSSQENKILLASAYYKRMGKDTKADSLENSLMKTFPKGIYARSTATNNIANAETPEEKEVAYQQWEQVFPPEDFPASERRIYDQQLVNIAQIYAHDDKPEKVRQMIDKMLADTLKIKAKSILAGVFFSKENYSQTKAFTQEIIAAMNSADTAKKPSAGKLSKEQYDTTILYAAIANLKLKDYEQANTYFNLYKERNGNQKPNPQVTIYQAQALLGSNKDEMAFQTLKPVIEAQQAPPETEQTFDELYLKLKGNTTELKNYKSRLDKKYRAKLNEDLASTMISEKAPEFSITDLEGDMVSLTDYKGKVVVLDFWATWCAPCKASFPAMQGTIEKYKNDADVQFLFVDTFDPGKNKSKTIKNYLEKENYDFKVLFDTPMAKSKNYEVAARYGIKGIPAKFIIDGNGNTRFQLTGFSGTKQAAIDELSAMIEMARNNS